MVRQKGRQTDRQRLSWKSSVNLRLSQTDLRSSVLWWWIKLLIKFSGLNPQSLLMSSSARRHFTLGEIVNLVSADTQKLMDFVVYFNSVWIAPIEIALCFYFLWQVNQQPDIITNKHMVTCTGDNCHRFGLHHTWSSWWNTIIMLVILLVPDQQKHLRKAQISCFRTGNQLRERYIDSSLCDWLIDWLTDSSSVLLLSLGSLLLFSSSPWMDLLLKWEANCRWGNCFRENGVCCFVLWVEYFFCQWVIIRSSPLLSAAVLYQEVQMKFMDGRIKLMNEILSGVKILKFYAWEEAFLRRVGVQRDGELNALKKSQILYSVSLASFNSSSFLVSITPARPGDLNLTCDPRTLRGLGCLRVGHRVCCFRSLWTYRCFFSSLSPQIALSVFGVYVLIDEQNVLDAQKIFVSVALINILKTPLSQLPFAMSTTMQACPSQ